MVGVEHNLGHSSRVPLHARRNQFFIHKRGELFPRQVAQVLFYPQLTMVTHVCVGYERVVSVVTSLVEPEAIKRRELLSQHVYSSNGQEE